MNDILSVSAEPYMKELDAKRERLLGDCLLTSSFLSFTGAFTFEFRRSLTYDLWFKDVSARSVPVSSPFRLETLLTNEAGPYIQLNLSCFIITILSCH